MRSFYGLNGRVSIEDNAVILTRESKFDEIFHELGVFSIPVSQITKVIYSPGSVTNGYMSFLRKGDRRPISVFTALKNKNTIIFRFTKNEEAKEIADYVKSLI